MIDHPHTYVSDACAKHLNRWANKTGVPSWSAYCVPISKPRQSLSKTFEVGDILLRPELWVDELGRRYVRWFIYEKPEWASMQEVLEFVEKALANETTA